MMELHPSQHGYNRESRVTSRIFSLERMLLYDLYLYSSRLCVERRGMHD